MSTKQRVRVPSMMLLLAATLLLMLHIPSSHGFKPSSSLTFHTSSSSSIRNNALTIRGGDSDYDTDSDSEYDASEYDDESEEEEEEEDLKLSASAVKALEKAKAKQKAEVKKTVSASLKPKPKAVKKKKRSPLVRIPYVVKAFMNPFTVFAMTRGYIASLFNIDYLQQDSSQDLRSALQEKARAETGGKKRTTRKFKPGQAKTLSDLPQLSA